MHRFLLLAILLIAPPLVCAAEKNGSDELIFKFQRGGTSGWITAWSGVFVRVSGNKVTPTFAYRRGVFPPLKYYHNKTLAIKACAKSDDYFDVTSKCFTTREPSITLPSDQSPYDYKYQFIYVVSTDEPEGPSKQEESFLLDKKSAEAAVKQKLEKQQKDLNRTSGRER